MTLMHTLVSGNEENQYKNSASTVIPEAGKAEHQIQLLASPLEDSSMQPDRLRTPARLTTTPEGAQFKHSPSTPDPSLTYIEDNPRAGEYQGSFQKGIGISLHAALLSMMSGKNYSQVYQVMNQI